MVNPVAGDAVATGLFVFISSIWEEVRVAPGTASQSDMRSVSVSAAQQRPSISQADTIRVTRSAYAYLKAADSRTQHACAQLGGMLSETGIPAFAAGLAVLITGLALFDPVAQMVGGHGVSFNPATSACFAAAGKGTWGSHARRMVRRCPWALHCQTLSAQPTAHTNKWDMTLLHVWHDGT